MENINEILKLKVLNLPLDNKKYKYGSIYIDGKLKDSLLETITSKEDVYYFLYQDNSADILSLANGYQINIPTKNKIKPNFMASQYRTQYETENLKLTISMESSNTYNNWKVYHDEWIMRYLTAEGEENKEEKIKHFFKQNNLEYTRKPFICADYILGYEVEIVSIVINDNQNISMPYYNIAIIHQKDEIKKFTLLVMKSKTEMHNEFDAIVKSIKFFMPYGIKKGVDTLKVQLPTYLNEKTKRYYKKMYEQQYVEWGFFNHSMYVDQCQNSKIKDREKKEEKELNYKFEIEPTYTHIGHIDSEEVFPLKDAFDLAGGDGFNNKKVIQFTLQFTTSNNEGLYGYTPMFDILRGKYDNYFRKLAKSIKEYKLPILFRVNNEMNSDWVSYCGQVTLLDPDIFVLTWERMANILKEEGCDNLLYIFNPTGKSYPYCSWGEDLCYLPSLEFVQFLGLTYYDYNNGEGPTSFENLYSWLYQKNMPHFKNYPAIISEFGCGSGGEASGKMYRNEKSQAIWIQEMFNLFNEKRFDNNPKYDFIRQIKAAIWFNADDYYQDKIKNKLIIDEENTPDTIKCFKEGLSKSKELN